MKEWRNETLRCWGSKRLRMDKFDPFAKRKPLNSVRLTGYCNFSARYKFVDFYNRWRRSVWLRSSVLMILTTYMHFSLWSVVWLHRAFTSTNNKHKCPRLGAEIEPVIIETCPTAQTIRIHWKIGFSQLKTRLYKTKCRYFRKQNLNL